jgi:hypothetical protein
LSDKFRPASYRRGYCCLQWAFVCTVEQGFHKSPIAVFRIRSFPAKIVKDEVRLQPRRRRAVADVDSIARPRVLLRCGDHPRSHRIEMDVAGKLQGIGVSLDKDCLVSSLQQMACPPPFDVDIRRVCTIRCVSSSAQGCPMAFPAAGDNGYSSGTRYARPLHTARLQILHMRETFPAPFGS